MYSVNKQINKYSSTAFYLFTVVCLCDEKWVRKSKTWLLFNLEDETNTQEEFVKICDKYATYGRDHNYFKL